MDISEYKISWNALVSTLFANANDVVYVIMHTLLNQLHHVKIGNFGRNMPTPITVIVCNVRHVQPCVVFFVTVYVAR